MSADKTESRVLAVGIAKVSLDALDKIPVDKAPGDGVVTALLEGKAHVLVDGMAVNTTDSKYGTTPAIESGVETSTYTGSDIANPNGKHPKLYALDGDKAKKGKSSAEPDTDVTKKEGHDSTILAAAINTLDHTKVARTEKEDVVANVGDKPSITAQEQ